MQSKYRVVTSDYTQEDQLQWMRHLTREREIDLLDYQNQITTNPVIFTRIPTSSSDLLGTEKAGDIAVDTSFLYVVVDNSGTLEWQRVGISTF